ncbi:hypothetical protein HS041_29785 [Planomonospora sp. ID67723]|uniref:ATP-binding protein n=1 Tax=Planomonospora sp. ID67723 TaxID=2738134 RepID=UPI0018C3A7B0|nr:histidine kinase [Planomonospora sp. ID67723]MBG0831905.1 hypothetical protein [Planomonospora sp. ID67723]
MSNAVPPPGSGGGTVDHPWLLPGAVTPCAGDREGVSRRRRSVRDWLVDGLFFVLAVAGVVVQIETSAPAIRPSGPPAFCGEALAGMGCLALWLRRRWPVGVALACAPLGVLVLPTVITSTTLAVFTVAVHRPARVALLVAAPVLATAPLYFAVHPDPARQPPSENIILSIMSTVAVLGWGMLVRSRRQVLASLWERAQRAETDQRLRAEQARRAERARIAREMHDVLAHRISLVSLHAGALEHGTDVTAEETSRAAGVIRAAAHQALQELREVIGLLRDRPGAPGSGPPPRPVPGDALEPAVQDPRDRDGGTHRAMWTIPAWAVDGMLFAASASVVALYGLVPGFTWASEPLRRADLVFGALACLALWLRRRWPVGVALACAPLGVFVFSAGLVAALAALFTVAVRRRLGTALLLSAFALAPAPLYFLARADQEPDSGELTAVPAGIMFVAAVLGWGMLVRSRRQLIDSLRERAAHAHRDQRLRMEQARRAERARIAREMHDVLAHRISLVSLHAGALEHGTDVTAEETSRAAGVIRANARQALRELREVIELLHEGPTVPGRPERPQPCLADVPELVAQSATAGNSVHYTTTVTDPQAIPAVTGRTIYRLIQEALTNVRKHAPGAEVRLALTASPGWLHLEVSNPLPATPPTGSPVPGSGTGLIGLAERVELADGYLTHGPAPDGTFRLETWIPCPI